MADYSIVTRSQTLNGATDREVIARGAALLDGGRRRRLVGRWRLEFTDAAQEELFDLEVEAPVVEETRELVRPRYVNRWVPGADVEHEEYGPRLGVGSGPGTRHGQVRDGGDGPGPVRRSVSRPEAEGSGSTDALGGGVGTL